MRVHIVQHGFKGKQGHLLQETAGWQHIFRQLKLPFRIYSHRALPAEIAEQFQCLPCFLQTPEAVVSNDPVIGKLKSILNKAAVFAQGLKFVSDSGVANDDLLIVTYALEAEILGMAQWLKQLPENCRPKIAFISHRSDFDFQIINDGKSVTHEQLYYLYAADQLSQVCPKERVAIFTANCSLWCSLLQQLTGLNVFDGPHHMFYESVELQDSLAVSEHIYDVGIMGIFRPEKGSLKLPEVIQSVCAQRPKIRFFLQLNCDEDIPDLQQWRSSLPNQNSVTIKIGGISMDEYRSILRQTSIQLLAYYWKSYYMRHSGVFSDAAAFGKPMVVPENSLLESLLNRYQLSGEVFARFDSNSISEAVIKAYDNREVMTQTALKQVTKWRTHNSVAASYTFIANKLKFNV